MKADKETFTDRASRKIFRPAFSACCIGYVSQAAVVNLMPVLFIPLREQFGFTYSQLGALVLVNFFTQLLADLLCSPLIDRLGFRVFAVAGHVFTVIGFLLFTLTPVLPMPPYYALIMATLLFSIGGGTLELVISPIVNAIPVDASDDNGKKSSAMSLLHSFYSWGQVSVALLTTLFLFVFGKSAWPVVVGLWALLPLFNACVFLRCRIPDTLPPEHRSPPLSVIKNPTFFIIILIILCAGAAEITISQWTSAFMEDVLALPKVVGDIGGMCAFALMMGIGRTLNGIMSAKPKIDGKSPQTAGLKHWMIAGAALSCVCYGVVALSSSPVVSLIACALCGLGVSLLWPGALSLAVEAFPMAGAWMLAILAAAGDSGASMGPWLAGLIGDRFGLRTSLLVSVVFPLGVVLLLWRLKTSRAEALR